MNQTVVEKKIENIPFGFDEASFYKFVERVTDKGFAKKVKITFLESENGYDRYRYYVRNGILHIFATSGCAGGSALNHYLRTTCKYYFGIIEKNGTVPKILPDTDGEIENESRFHYRYAFNYCTFGYSYAFNTWDDWERVTDYLILSGYNLVLNPIGTECIFLELLQKYGYTESEAKKYVSAPNYLPWQWMLNLSGVHGNPSDDWYRQQREIACKFNRKLSSFGMSAVLPGYCGAVPNDFGERNADAVITNQGKWGMYDRPAILCGCDLFDRVAENYYAIQGKLLDGKMHHYYSVDAFHEGGNKKDIDIGQYARQVFSAMKKYDDKAVWCFQGWQGNPDREMLLALKKEDVLIMNLHADTEPTGDDGFLQYPSIYCTVNNFGGEQCIRGGLEGTLIKPYDYLESDEVFLVGVGLMPEGVECDEIIFDTLSYIAINHNKPTMKEYIRGFLHARYGVDYEDLFKAVESVCRELLKDDVVAFDRESGFLARPSINADRVCYWAGHSTVFEDEFLKSAILTYKKYLSELKDNPCFMKDMVALLRQFMTNKAWRCIYVLNGAVQDKDLTEFDKQSELLLEMFDVQTKVVSFDKHLSFNAYLQKAMSRGKTKEEKTYYKENAIRLITSWSDNIEDLNDYSAREYPELLVAFYKPRWQEYLKSARKNIETGETISVDYKKQYENVIRNYQTVKIEQSEIDKVTASVLDF